jgi:hypothetical protein
MPAGYVSRGEYDAHMMDLDRRLENLVSMSTTNASTVASLAATVSALSRTVTALGENVREVSQAQQVEGKAIEQLRSYWDVTIGLMKWVGGSAVALLGIQTFFGVYSHLLGL